MVRHRPVVDVAEVPLGARLADVLPLQPAPRRCWWGGYHGSWLPTAVAADLTLERSSLASGGASLAPG